MRSLFHRGFRRKLAKWTLPGLIDYIYGNAQIQNGKHTWMLDTRCWILDAWYWRIATQGLKV